MLQRTANHGQAFGMANRTAQAETHLTFDLTAGMRRVVRMQALVDNDRVFGALADATRRDIVRRAIDGDEGVAELAAHYPMSFAAVQKHVAILERAGLVTKQRIGRRRWSAPTWPGCVVARRLLDRYEEL